MFWLCLPSDHTEFRKLYQICMFMFTIIFCLYSFFISFIANVSWNAYRNLKPSRYLQCRNIWFSLRKSSSQWQGPWFSCNRVSYCVNLKFSTYSLLMRCFSFTWVCLYCKLKPLSTLPFASHHKYVFVCKCNLFFYLHCFVTYSYWNKHKIDSTTSISFNIKINCFCVIWRW